MKTCKELNIELCYGCEEGFPEYCWTTAYYSFFSSKRNDKSKIIEIIKRDIEKSEDYLFYIKEVIKHYFPEHSKLLLLI
jgi:hypothetical protein